MIKLASFLLLCLLAGCAFSTLPPYTICSTQPGTYACQVEQYENVSY
jgi:hypothetical protein